VEVLIVMVWMYRLSAPGELLCGIFITALFLGGCGEGKQSGVGQSASSQEHFEKSKAKPAHVEKMQSPQADSRATARLSGAAQTKHGETQETSAGVVATTTAAPSPIQDVLDALDKIPVTITDRVTTQQVESVQAAILALEDKYMGARLLASDREQAELQEKLESLSKMAEELLAASSPDELREKYRQLSESVKLLDAEIMQRARERVRN
jgi:hypothetical protein